MFNSLAQAAIWALLSFVLIIIGLYIYGEYGGRVLLSILLAIVAVPIWALFSNNKKE